MMVFIHRKVVSEFKCLKKKLWHWKENYNVVKFVK